jgi:hypothetical protein
MAMVSLSQRLVLSVAALLSLLGSVSACSNSEAEKQASLAVSKIFERYHGDYFTKHSGETYSQYKGFDWTVVPRDLSESDKLNDVTYRGTLHVAHEVTVDMVKKGDEWQVGSLWMIGYEKPSLAVIKAILAGASPHYYGP